MIKKEQLFILIKSLSKAEKRYFRLSCRQAETASNYLKLFDAMDAQEEYDEKAIRKKFKKETFCNQLHVTKNYLRQLILKSLRNFHTRISKDAELKDALRNVEILFHKELYPLCYGELKKAETIARAFEINSGLSEIMSWKRRLEQALNSQQNNALIELLCEQEKAIEAMRNTNLHWQHAVNTSRAAISNTASDRRKIKNSRTATLENAQTLEAKVLFYNTAYLTNLRNGLQDKAEQALTALLTLLESFPHRIQEDPAIYISSANNLVSYFVFSRQYDKAIALINRSRVMYENAMQQHEKRSLLKQILRTYNIELEIYRDKRSFEQNLTSIKHIESFITRHVAKIPADYLLSFWFQLANIHFMRKDFDQSLKWINLILNTRFQHVRTDLQIHARMMNLMIHLEQDNLFVLRYFVDSTRRFMKKAKPIQPFEQTLLGFFSKIGQTPKFEHKDRFKELQQQLFSSNPHQIPAEIMDYIDYKNWINGKG
jgi:hypothetical protein